MKELNTDTLKDAIEYAGYEWREYSGRGMYGRKCVGVTLSDASDLFALGAGLADYCDEESLPYFPNPTTDSMGRGIIAYWPRFGIVDAA